MLHLHVRGKSPLPNYAAEDLIPEIVASLLNICNLEGDFILTIQGEGFLGVTPPGGIKIVSINQRRLELHVVGREGKGRFKCFLFQDGTDPNKLMNILRKKLSKGWYHYDPQDQPAEIQRTVTPDDDSRVQVNFKEDAFGALAAMQDVLLNKRPFKEVKAELLGQKPKVKVEPKQRNPLEDKLKDMAGKAARFDRAVKRIEIFEAMERQVQTLEAELVKHRAELEFSRPKYDEDKKVVEDDEFKKARANYDQIKRLVDEAD